MRNMSYALTKDQMYAETKSVTRRLGWRNLKAGELVMACEKCQGLKKGEKVVKIYPIRISSVDIEHLCAIRPGDAVKEGFPELTEAEFVDMFCREMKCNPRTLVTRIEFRKAEKKGD